MGIEALTPPTAFPSNKQSGISKATTEKVVEFSNNRLLVDLCGAYDRNLANIEQQIGVNILRQGNRLKIVGETEACNQAAAILNEVYTYLESGKDISAADFDIALRAGSCASMEDHEQIELFSGQMELRTRKKSVTPRTKAQKSYVQNLLENELSFGIGPAGTGKTYLAMAVGITLFLSGNIERIVLSRPAVEAGERLGFLPGDMKDKVDPYMQPLYDALNDFLPAKQTQKLIEDKRIEIAPLAFMRGRTLANSFIVLDEAQNATSMQMKMFLTRLGEGSRMVITGDISQIDLPRGAQSGLNDAIQILKDIKGISFNYFTSKDVIRHPLVARIVEAYDTKNTKGIS